MKFLIHLWRRNPATQKILLTMRLTLLLLVISVFSAFSNTYAQKTKLDINVQNSSVKDVLDAIETQSEFFFMYNNKQVDVERKVDLDARSATVDVVLQKLFAETNINYKIVNRQILLFPANTISSVAVQQEKKVTGKVSDKSGASIPGASVVVTGTTTGITTNADGDFSLVVPAGNNSFSVSFIGMKTQEITIDNNTTFKIVLEEQSYGVNEVVVTALGIKKEVRSLTYNVQKIDAKEITGVGDGTFVNSLAGKVAGVTINSSSAGTGSSSRVVMRGIKSINGNNNALFVVDGIPMPNNIRTQATDIFSGAGQTGDAIANINPEDIESISILSGPSAAALYGSAAANGVVMVTTKRGQKNMVDVTLTNSTTFSNPLLLPRFQNTYGQSGVGSYYSWGQKLVTPSTYKPADFFQSGVNINTTLSISTGTEKSQTYFSLGNVTASGIIPSNNFGRYNFSVRNTSQYLDGKMTLDVGFMAGLVNEQNMVSQGQYFNPLIAVYLFPAGEDFNKVKAYERYNPTRNFKTQYWPARAK